MTRFVVMLQLCVVAASGCLLAVSADAGEAPRQKPMALPSGATANVQKPPSRVVLISTTNTLSLAGNLTPHLHRSSSQWSVLPTTDGRRFGKSIATADIDGDGILDLFFGQPRGPTTRQPGSVSILFGDKLSAFGDKPTVIEGTSARDMFGSALANVGDVNGDGLTDVAIGAPEYSARQISEGSLSLIYGRRGDKPHKPNLHFGSGHPRVQLAISVASAGDVNGDGFNDVLIGAPRLPARSFQEGGVYLCLGSPTGLVTQAVWTYYGDQREAHCGQAVTAVGDVNGDGFSDILVGMPDFDTPQTDAGRVLLFLGSKSGLKDKPDWSADGPHAHARFGAALAAAGDLNGDGHNDVLIGTPGLGDAVKVSGWVFAYFGTGGGFAKSPAWAVSDEHEGARFGAAIAGLGDINGDGHADVLIGEPGFDGQYADQGRVCLFLGNTSGLSTTPDWTLEGGQPGAECGGCVVSVSDLNRDGLSDFAVGSPAYSTFRTKEGRVDIFLGSRSAYDRRNDFPTDGSNSTALPREWFKPVQPAPPAPSPVMPAKVFYLVGVGLLFVLGFGLMLWRRSSRMNLQKERQRLARDLHDQVGPHLARISQLENIGDTDAARDVATAIEQAVWAADPGHDMLESLIAFVSSQAERLVAGTGIRCLFDLPEMPPDHTLSGEIRGNVVLAVREAFANAIKHSGASEIWLHVKFETPELTIHIEDNGRGIPPGPTRRFGKGLKNMRERMESIGGSCELGSSVNGGVRVTLRLRV